MFPPLDCWLNRKNRKNHLERAAIGTVFTLLSFHLLFIQPPAPRKSAIKLRCNFIKSILHLSVFTDSFTLMQKLLVCQV